MRIILYILCFLILVFIPFNKNYANESGINNNNQRKYQIGGSTGLTYTVNRFILDDSNFTLSLKESVSTDTIPQERELPVLQEEKGSESERIITLIRQYFPENWQVALAIARAESIALNSQEHNFNPDTRDDSYCHFQINLFGNLKYGRPKPEELLDPVICTQFARKLYDQAGGSFKDWTTYKNGKYLKYLP